MPKDNDQQFTKIHLLFKIETARELLEHGVDLFEMSEAEAYERLDELESQGGKFIICKGCDNYDGEGRCLGHAK